MRLFGPYDCDVTDTPCEGDAVHANFSNFIIGANLLYRVATSDGWTVIYQRYLHLMESKRWLVHIYFISFFFLGTLVLLNLFIGFVLEAFGDNQGNNKFECFGFWYLKFIRRKQKFFRKMMKASQKTKEFWILQAIELYTIQKKNLKADSYCLMDTS